MPEAGTGYYITLHPLRFGQPIRRLLSGSRASTECDSRPHEEPRASVSVT
jgi:hypothetical protein